MNNNLLVLTREEEAIARSLELTELREKLQNQLEEEVSDFAFLEEEKATIGNPEKLGEVIKTVVWEEVINQIASKAGEDFIKENNGLNLDLSKTAHIQTSGNFENGIIATHNYISREQLEKNYDRYKNKPHSEFREEYVNPGMDETLERAGKLKNQGIDTVTDIYTGRQIPTETKLENGKNNPEAAQREHVSASVEIYGNASLQMANDNEQLADIINSPENLQGYTTAKRNNRKSDKSADEMDECDKTKHWEKADKRSKEFIEQKEREGEERLRQEGMKTRKEETFRIGGKTLRAVVMQLLAELIKEVISKLVKWLKSAGKKLETLLASLKEAIVSFVGKLKVHLMNAADCAVTTIATALFGPVVNTIKKIFILFKQGYRSLKEAVMYIKRPENRGKPIGILTLEVGKIVTAGFTAIGGIVLGEVIEKGLMAIPGAGVVFAFEIPLLGSLANILGIFLGALVAGIIGAIAVNMIDKAIAKKKKAELTSEMVGKNNEILSTQNEIFEVEREQMIIAGKNMVSGMARRHSEVSDIIRRSASELFNADSNYDNKENFRKICELSAECNSRLTVIKNF